MTSKVKKMVLISGLSAFVVGLVIAIIVGQRSGGALPQSYLENLAKSGIYIHEEGTTVPAVALLDQQGNPFNIRDLEGTWSFVFFGYTYCPDICPTTLVTFKKLEKALSESGFLDDTRFVMVSVDPKRDTPERLNAYLAFFNPDYLGLTGDVNAITALARSVNVGFRIPDKQPGGSQDNGDSMKAQNFEAGQGNQPNNSENTGLEAMDDYLVDHSTHILLLNPDVQLAGVFQMPHREALMASVYQRLRQD
ncbi:electron transport protein SCO1/SenC [Oleiphilus messinensis]|uniref:Electron transport protein SCO1/SenC n=1 Tax=Oleiphilus messinensis TaxID=141451 RepID=A0A1Y0I124_9GAMM|nr:SCO family protein [Oleiphilus messinensis]ARU54158.1 electron transport protein SCO1/SenC [Oleiphilus messinensis]